MNDRFKRIAIIVGFVLVAAVVGMAVYAVFFRTAPAPIQEPSSAADIFERLPPSGTGSTRAPGEEETGIPKAGSVELPKADAVAKGGVTETTALTTAPVSSPTLSEDGKGMQYYDRTSNQFYRIAADGTVSALSAKKFPDVENVSWNATATKAVMEFPDGANIVYDFSSGEQVSLPTHWEDFHFSPANDEIAAKSIGVDPNNRSLVITNADGSNARAVASLGENADKVELSWAPHDQVIGFADTAPSISGVGRKTILPIGKNEENFKGLTVEGFDFQSLWAPNGDKLLYSSAGAGNNYKPMLWIVDGRPNTIGNNRRSIGVETWADKCTFGNPTTVYCAVPMVLPANAGLQRSLADDIADAVVKIDIQSGRQERVAIPETTQSIRSLSVSSDGATLFFTGNRTGVLQRMRLK